MVIDRCYQASESDKSIVWSCTPYEWSCRERSNFQGQELISGCQSHMDILPYRTGISKHCEFICITLFWPEVGGHKSASMLGRHYLGILITSAESATVIVLFYKRCSRTDVRACLQTSIRPRVRPRPAKKPGTVRNTGTYVTPPYSDITYCLFSTMSNH